MQNSFLHGLARSTVQPYESEHATCLTTSRQILVLRIYLMLHLTVEGTRVGGVVPFLFGLARNKRQMP